MLFLLQRKDASGNVIGLPWKIFENDLEIRLGGVALRRFAYEPIGIRNISRLGESLAHFSSMVLVTASI